MSNTVSPLTLPDGWQPGDKCGNCGRPILHHRADGFACPASTCNPEHMHTRECWTFLTFRPDPITEARERVERTMAPEGVK